MESRLPALPSEKAIDVVDGEEGGEDYGFVQHLY